MQSQSFGVRKLWIEAGNPRPITYGTLVAERADDGSESWEVYVTITAKLFDVLDECSVIVELEDGRAVTGLAVLHELEVREPPNESRFVFRSSKPLTGFDWSELDSS
jgi:hypothetical protein